MLIELRDGEQKTVSDNCQNGHQWVYFIADDKTGTLGGTPYYFCEICRHTLLPGRGIFGFKECECHNCKEKR